MSKKKTKVPPRKTSDRDDWYMGLAFWIAAKSKDPDTQNGAVIVSGNVIIGTGYNGPPATYAYTEVNWSRPSKPDDTDCKYPHVIHAEENAMIHCQLPLLLPGSVVYVTARPCKDCILRLAAHGIKKGIYFNHPSAADPESMLNKHQELIEDIAKRGKVELVEFKGNLNWMRDRMLFLEELGIF